MKSMTGFGKAIQEGYHFQADVEIKSVNHRFLDIQIHAPKQFNPLENELRQMIKNTLARGRVEVYVTLRKIGSETRQVQVDWSLIDSLVRQIREGATTRYGESFTDVTGLLERVAVSPEFVSIQEAVDESKNADSLIVETAAAALKAIEESRQKEGTALQKVLEQNQEVFQEKLQRLQTFVSTYEREFQQRYRQKLHDYLEAEVEEQRLLTELAVLLERGDIHEEIDRLVIHLENLRNLLTRTGPVGREMDFLLQEMNREVNTIGSKSTAIEIKELVVQMKTILEKIREQIQNIE